MAAGQVGVGRDGRALAGDHLGQLGVLAGVGHDHLVADRPLEDRVEHRVVLADRPGRQPFGGRLGHPVLHKGRRHLREQLLAEEGIEVLVEVRRVRRLRRWLDVLGFPGVRQQRILE